MAREGKKLLHIHSNVPNKQPKPEFIEPGELAVNNAAGNEFISTKNSDGEVVRFSSDGKMVGIIENKEVMAYEGAVLEPTEEDLINNKSELLIKLNQMVAAQTPGSDDVNGARDMHGDEINPFDEDTKRGGAGFAINMDRYAMQGANPSFSSVTTDAIHANEGGDVVIDRQPTQTLSSTTYGGALEELATKIGEGVDGLFSSVEYISSGDTKEIIFKDRDGDVVGSVDATDFVIDGMVDNVSIEDVVIVEGEEPVKCMVITFNTDAGKQNINIPLTDIFDPSVLDNYYTKEEINNALGNLFTPSSVTSSVTEVIVENERVTSAALNDLDTRVRVLEALEDDVVVSGDVNSDSGIITLKTLEGNTPQVTGLSEYVDGRISSLSGDNYVTSGSVEGTSGIITLNRQNGDAQVTGLAEFVDGRVSSLSGDTYVTSGSVDENSGIITLNRQNGDAQVTGLAEYVNGKIGELSAIATDAEVVSESGDTKIVFKDKDGNEISGLTIDANEFVKDGMVTSVEIGIPESGSHAGVKCLIITWNDDSNVDPLVTEIPLSDIFDPAILDDYYTKAEINDALGDWFAPSAVTSSVTEVIIENEHVTSAALNDLNSRVTILESEEDDVVVSGAVNANSGIITLKTLEGNTPQVTGLSEYVDGRISSLSGDNYVTSGSVDGNSGVITLNRQNGDAQVTGLAEYINGKIVEVSGDTNNYVTGGDVDTNNGIITLQRDGLSAVTVSGLSEYVDNRLGELDAIATDAEVVSESGDTKIVFKDKDGNVIDGLTVDANQFVKDGMVMSVEIGTPASGPHAGVECLIITWNNDSAPDVDPLVTEIPLSDIFDPAVLDNYYTKSQINDVLGEWFVASAVTSSVTEVIAEIDEVTSAALNDLNTRVLDLENATDNVVDGGSVDSDSGIITLNTTEGDVINVDGLADFINGKIAASSGDTYVTGGSINQSSGIITLSRQSGSTEISGLSEYVDSKIPSVSSDYLPLSGGTVTGDTTFDENVDVSGLLTTKTIEVDTGETIHASYTSGDVFPNDPRDDYDFVTGLDGRTVLSDFLLPSATTQDDGKVVMNVNGEWQAVEDRWLDWSGDTLDGDIIFTDRIDGTDDYGIIYNSENEVDIKVNGGMEAASGFTHMGITGSQGLRINRNDYVLLGGGGYMAISAISPSVTDRWVDTSGDTMTGNLEFHNGAMQSLHISATTGKITNGLGGGYSTNGGDIVTNTGDISAEHGDVHGQTVTVSGDSQQAADAPKLMVYGDVEVYPSGTTSPMLLHITPDAGNGESILTVSGDITATGAMYSSDKRLKENIRFLSDEDIENAKSVEFKAFNLISNKSTQKFGVIAQDLQDNGLGKLTGTNEAGFLTVDYISLLCLKIAQLEREIEELKKGK